MSLRTAGRALLAGMAALTLASTAQAQAPVGKTPEGTRIVNHVTATYRDGIGANTTQYTASPDSAVVRVGFVPGVTLSADETVTPPSGGTGLTYSFTLTNGGNGKDRFSIDFAPSSSPRITITGVTINGTGAPLTGLQITTDSLAMDSTVTITVTYDLTHVEARATETIGATATSLRSAAIDPLAPVTDTHTLTIEPAAVGVDAPVDRSELPGKRTAEFTITNFAKDQLVYVLTSSIVSGGATVDSIVGGTGASYNGTTRELTINGDASTTVIVHYTIPSAATLGAQSVIRLTATEKDEGAVTDSDDYTVTVTRPVVALRKRAFRSDGTTAIADSGQVMPLEVIVYKITVTNNGDAEAREISVDDALPADVDLEGSPAFGEETGTWTFSGPTSGTLTAKLTSLPAGESATFWVRVKIK